MSEYTVAEQATLRQILAAYGAPADRVADRVGILRRLLGPEPAYATPAAAAAVGTWVEVLAVDNSQASRVGEAESVAESVWPQIAAFM